MNLILLISSIYLILLTFSIKGNYSSSNSSNPKFSRLISITRPKSSDLLKNDYQLSNISRVRFDDDDDDGEQETNYYQENNKQLSSSTYPIESSSPLQLSNYDNDNNNLNPSKIVKETPAAATSTTMVDNSNDNGKKFDGELFKLIMLNQMLMSSASAETRLKNDGNKTSNEGKLGETFLEGENFPNLNLASLEPNLYLSNNMKKQPSIEGKIYESTDYDQSNYYKSYAYNDHDTNYDHDHDNNNNNNNNFNDYDYRNHNPNLNFNNKLHYNSNEKDYYYSANSPNQVIDNYHDNYYEKPSYDDVEYNYNHNHNHKDHLMRDLVELKKEKSKQLIRTKTNFISKSRENLIKEFNPSKLKDLVFAMSASRNLKSLFNIKVSLMNHVVKNICSIFFNKQGGCALSEWKPPILDP